MNEQDDEREHCLMAASECLDPNFVEVDGVCYDVASCIYAERAAVRELGRAELSKSVREFELCDNLRARYLLERDQLQSRYDGLMEIVHRLNESHSSSEDFAMAALELESAKP